MKNIIKILQIEQLTPNIKKFQTNKPKNYNFISGQAAQIAINKSYYKEQFRPFTFTSLNEDNYLEFIIKEYPDHNGVTKAIHELNIGDELIITEPVGTIKYKGEGIFLAGGVGITPFISIFRDLERKQKLNGNTLIFSNKTKNDIIIEDELKKMFSQKHLILTLSEEKENGYAYGRIDKSILTKYIKDVNQYFYACGPLGFEDTMIEDLTSLGADRNKIIIEEW
jgi:hypothetical protein